MAANLVSTWFASRRKAFALHSLQEPRDECSISGKRPADCLNVSQFLDGFHDVSLALGPGNSETRRKRNIGEAIKETAKHLGNRPAACRKYYIHPAVLEGYEEQTLFAAMRATSKRASTGMAGLHTFEIATLRLVSILLRSKTPEGQLG